MSNRSRPTSPWGYSLTLSFAAVVLVAGVALVVGVGCSSDTTPSPDALSHKDLAARDDSALDDGSVSRDHATPSDADASGDTLLVTDGSPSPDSGTTGSARANCLKRSQAIRAKTGATIEVTPGTNGHVIVKGKSTTLRQVVSGAKSGETILLADGTYTFQESTGGGSYTGLYFTRANVTMRSKSGDRDKVILDSNYADHGGETAVITVAAAGIVLADFTVKRSIFHLIHLWADGDKAILQNLRLIDGGQQFVKSSPGSGKSVDGVEVTCSAFIMTSAGRDNVWGYGALTGNTRCYTGGIDTHDSRNWRVADNRFEGIYCDPSGLKHPAHGKKASLRGGLTYSGGLAEYAIHMWDSPQGSAHVIERNQIVNCARGIGVGMATDVYGTSVRNNTVFSKHAGSAEHDVGINVERGHNVSVFNNTVFLSSPKAYSNAIEYRWGSTAGVQIRNNLTNHAITSRNSATATLSHNVTKAQGAWFVGVASGDLHLVSCSNAAVDAKGKSLAEVKDDLDGDLRAGSNDVGADQCVN